MEVTGISVCDNYHLFLDRENRLVGVAFIHPCEDNTKFFIKRMVDNSLQYVGVTTSIIKAMEMVKKEG